MGYLDKPSIQDHGGGYFAVAHMAIDGDVQARLAGARRLALWNVRPPQDFFGQLPRLVELEVAGGSAKDLALVRAATHVRRLAIMRVPAATDLAWLPDLTALESLALFGLPRIERLPSLAGLARLRFAQVGLMIRLTDLSGLADAPALEELRFTLRLGVTAESMKPFVGHPTLARFGWWWEEGVTASQARGVLDALPLPRPDWDAGDIGAQVTSADAD